MIPLTEIGVDLAEESTSVTVSQDTGGNRASGALLLDLRVLLIEDDPEVALTLQRFLQRSGMQTVVAHSGGAAATLKATFSPHVVLVDLELPDINGETFIRWLLEQHDCGIIVVSGRGDEATRVLSLELGADDYVTKPPNLRELVARIRAVYRRSSERRALRTREAEGRTVSVGDFTVDLDSHLICDRMERTVDVTAAEFAVMAALIEAKGLPVSREHLSELALHRPWRPEDRSVDQLIFGLRRKLPMPEGGRCSVQSVRNAGYALLISSTHRP